MAISLFDASSVSKESITDSKLPFGYEARRTAAFVQRISTVGLRHDAVLRAHDTDRASTFDLNQIRGLQIINAMPKHDSKAGFD
ncbi:hypothetical protein JQ561_12325 [Bradyrhizobium diazoefficiens]|jgi:hypothetical protein|uniref:hypothetical protein n=1 Tax=Bradyrhizobium sp. WYCCWR 12699 TaxID=3064203 RepID=UPI001BA634B8|nr:MULTISPECIES: hypothetical protein [Bradyrhizobium]MBR0927393.1 hypothetical protein [Bradyrhizobium diazoefficiens]MDT4741284.1 hypothetical protein [Bradyrhizobium sp. WYCCWR 12699]